MNRPNPKHILPVLQAEIEDGNWDMLETMCTSAFYADGEWLELEEIEDFDGANDLMNELRVVTGPHAREARQLFGEIYSTRVPKYAHSGGYFPCALSEFCLVRAETNTQCAALLEPKPMTHILPHLFQL